MGRQVCCPPASLSSFCLREKKSPSLVSSLSSTVDFLVDFLSNTVMLSRKIDQSRFLLVTPQLLLEQWTHFWGVQGCSGRLRVAHTVDYRLALNHGASTWRRRKIDWVPLQRGAPHTPTQKQHATLEQSRKPHIRSRPNLSVKINTMAQPRKQHEQVTQLEQCRRCVKSGI